ncbi:MAG: DNA-processing protein DprA [Ilumatobacteraceae bacterium]
MTARHADADGAVAALARLPGVGAARLAALLRRHDPVDAFERLAAGRPLDDRVSPWFRGDQLVGLRAAAKTLDPAAEADRLVALGVAVTWLGRPDYPAILAVDPDPPTTLFSVGSFALLERRRVAVVGTRNASTAGLATARELGQGLARSGVAVVSGLARGVDGAAHTGVREADGGAVAVVGSGPDVVPGTPPWSVGVGLRRRTPVERVAARHTARRLAIPGPEPHIAALSEVLVVVESRARRQSHHGRTRARPRRRGDGRPGLTAHPIVARHQRVVARRSGTGDVSRRRPGHPRARPPPGGVGAVRRPARTRRSPGRGLEGL